MALNRLLSAAALVALASGAAWLAQDAAANFADAAGFSGRGGATCIACHTLAPLPTEPAEAHLEGLPDAWDPGETYRLTVRVTGGPPAMPAPQPQGGFDLSIDGGRISIPDEMQGLVRTPNEQEATYLPAGTLMREWQVDWTAPGLEARPIERRVWLAVISANGNHVIALNGSDGGERFDAAAHLALTVPPAPEALQAWLALPLAAPQAAATMGDGFALVEGRHGDGNATHVAWSLDGGDWQLRETGADWRVRFEGLDPGEHRLAYRSEGADRRSPEQELGFTVPGFALDLPGDRDSPPAGAAPLALAFLALALVLSRSRRL